MLRIRTVVVVALLAAALFIPAPVAAADDDWIAVTVASRHHKRGYQEHNWGLGFEHGINERWRAIGGFYLNSYDRQTVYAGVLYQPWRFGDWRIGGAALLATGYEGYPAPMAYPVISYERKSWGVNFGPVLPTVVGVQIKFKY